MEMKLIGEDGNVFIGRLERISKNWFTFIGNAELSGLKERLPQPIE